ncbi:ABC transporter ATP-binding protein [Rhodococcus sp. NPDC058521]|uniref:ABC transporter ATP-binding protein n=1 Tax=Rhodococcus sp. NPDC058521 TaxID=3346536 RepID=UPI00364AA223
MTDDEQPGTGDRYTHSREGNLVTVDNLTVRNRQGDLVLDGFSLTVSPNAAHAVIGSSGGGKTTAALALVGHLRRGLTRVRGTVDIDGVSPFDVSPAELRTLRRSAVYVGQDPGSSLTPTMTVAQLLDESKAADADPVRVLESVHLPADPTFRSRFPHQLSGGQRRRVALARALMSRPKLLIVDEPTAGLDPLTLTQVINELHEARARFELSLVLITHDLDTARELTDTASILDRGRVVEAGPTKAVLSRPRSDALIEIVRSESAVRDQRPAHVPLSVDTGPKLKLSGVTVGPGTSRTPLFAPVDLQLCAGESVGLIGRSGVGKSTLVRAIVGLHPALTGSIGFNGNPPAKANRENTAHPIALVPQDPDTSLNPALSIRTSITRALPGRRDRGGEVARLLTQVGLDPTMAQRRPSALSGGQRQRVALARALAGQPQVLLCDEVTSALDAVTEEKILSMLDDIRQRHRLALVVITHSRAVVDRLCERVVELRSLEDRN